MTLLIFDFDGTIVDSKALYYGAMNKHLAEYGFTKRKIDKAIDIGLSVAETLRKMGFSSFLIWFLKRRIMKNVLLKVNEVKKCKDVDSIRKIPGRKILVSNSILEFVMPILKHLKLKNEFSEIYGAESFSDKAEFIRDYLKKRKVKAKDCYYVGDRASDVLIAREIKCRSIIISGKCAWDSRKEILAANPDYIIDDIKDIEKII